MVSSRLRGAIGLWGALAVVAAVGLVLFYRGLSADRCSEPTEADCIRAAYVGAPDDYAGVADIPAAALLAPGADGHYDVRSGQQVTVVTAAQLPADSTHFLLQRSPPGSPAPVSFEQLVPSSGTTYTFTVSEDEVGPTLLTFDLIASRPSPGSGPDVGDVVVTTVFRVASCASGIAVPDPVANDVLVGECERMLAIRDILVGTGALDWSVARPMTDWVGVTVGGTPRRVTKLELADSGLTGELSGLLGTLTALTALRLDGNALTGTIPSKLVRLTLLTDVYLADNDLAGCVPGPFRRKAHNDISALGLADCGAPRDVSVGFFGDVLTAGTYRFGRSRSYGPLVFDIPPGARIELRSLVVAGPEPGTGSSTHGLILADEATRSWICLDLERAIECGRSVFPTESGFLRDQSVDATLDRIAHSLW